jgi:hypothetical protein
MRDTVNRSARAAGRFALAFAVLVGAGAAAAGQPPPAGAGIIEGRVVDAATADPLPGATVIVTGSVGQASTNRDGVFRLTGVPAGDRSVVVTYPGRVLQEEHYHWWAEFGIKVEF